MKGSSTLRNWVTPVPVLRHTARVPKRIAASMMMPPMVGVPALGRWDLGPSSRSVWPNLSFLSSGITNGPSRIAVRALTSTA